LIFVALLVAAHVAGNAIGSQLRDQSSRELSRRESRPALPLRPIERDTPRLCTSTTLGRAAFAMTIVGAIGGAIAGWLVFDLVDHGQLAGGDWAIGIASCAALGGFWSFLGAGFFQIGCWPTVQGLFARGSAAESESREADRCDLSS
jgi:hypothetical protein